MVPNTSPGVMSMTDKPKQMMANGAAKAALGNKIRRDAAEKRKMADPDTFSTSSEAKAPKFEVKSEDGGSLADLLGSSPPKIEVKPPVEDMKPITTGPTILQKVLMEKRPSSQQQQQQNNSGFMMGGSYGGCANYGRFSGGVSSMENGGGGNSLAGGGMALGTGGTSPLNNPEHVRLLKQLNDLAKNPNLDESTKTTEISKFIKMNPVLSKLFSHLKSNKQRKNGGVVKAAAALAAGMGSGNGMVSSGGDSVDHQQFQDPSMMMNQQQQPNQFNNAGFNNGFDQQQTPMNNNNFGQHQQQWNGMDMDKMGNIPNGYGGGGMIPQQGNQYGQFQGSADQGMGGMYHQQQPADMWGGDQQGGQGGGFCGQPQQRSSMPPVPPPSYPSYRARMQHFQQQQQQMQQMQQPPEYPQQMRAGGGYGGVQNRFMQPAEGGFYCNPQHQRAMFPGMMQQQQRMHQYGNINVPPHNNQGYGVSSPSSGGGRGRGASRARQQQQQQQQQQQH